MTVARVCCKACDATTDGDFEVSPLASLPLEDQLFVVAFLRHHGSLRRMEELFGISYPTVKNRLNAIVGRLDRSFEGPSANTRVLDALAAGEITVEEALRRIV
jgi:hypothetical protein